MTASRDPDRMIHHFLLEGGEELHDQVYDAVRADIEQTRQRVFIGPWRLPTMNKLVPIGLGAAAVAVVLVVGASVLRTPSSDSAGVGAAPTAAPSPVAEGGLPVGSAHVLSGGLPRITVTIPAQGWTGDTGSKGGTLVKNGSVDPSDGAGMITFAGPLYVYGDPCTWESTTPATPATTVDEILTALAAQASRDASDPVDVTVGGYAGKAITLTVPDDATFSECDQGYFGSWGTLDEPTPARYQQGPGQIDEVWILDVNGVPTVIDTTYYAGTPAEHVAEIRAIVESATFE